MPHKKLLSILEFSAKENASGIFIKKYSNGYAIEVDLEKETFYFGGKTKVGEKESQNITKSEDWVVLECVDKLLEKGYKPENISLEKVYPAGHGFSGRLDICVTHDDGSEYLLIECKTYGKEFDKAFTRLKKDGGQLFTYFKFSNKADIIMLYASELKGNEIVYRNEIIKIEEDYKTGDVKDFYQKWNKLTKDNGVLETWVKPYNFESKALTPKLLKPIEEIDSSLIFNQFLEILRHNVVSDKPNAFNKIFTLFLCKVYDEKTTRPNDELKFQWIEGKDTLKGEDAYVSFLIRLSDLYKNGMLEFLEKEITDFSEVDFERKYKHLDDSIKKDLLKEFNKIRLEKNNEFAIKEVFDKQSFLENGKIVKEVVELLQGFRIRYNKRQQYLSNFFELLLTTGLKQESGQFFTPVPVAQFIIKSLPIDSIVNEKLVKGSLPYIIDYAAGSGHFLTESMHEIQKIINSKTNNEFTPIAQEKIIKWQSSHFDWATQFVYGIEKDYRLVKVGKVGCYLHGDGLANVLLSDGLGSFKNTKEYKGLLKETKEDFPQDNGQFDIIVSNPPYSVSSFKRTTTDYYTTKDFELYDKLTENSSEIECLFIERTKQLLKDGGVAGIILPSSILSNTGIYSKSREIILQYFDIIGITELGSNTFMATGTNTVTLFLRRRNNYESINLKIAVEKFFTSYQDVTLNGIEKPVTKYVNHVWETISFDDYVSLLKKEPNKVITEHEIYKEYRKKLKVKNEKEFWSLVLEKETEKLYYFIIAYSQKVVLIKSGEKNAEKRFLGYEFSNRRGSEGIHPVQRSKNIEDCTQMFDADVFDNPEKASTYIYKAFAGDFDFEIDEAMQKNVTRHDLVDMLTFDRVDFEKNISLSTKKKVNPIDISNSKHEIKTLQDVAEFKRGPFGGSLKKEIFVESGFKVYEQQHAIKNDFSLGRYFINEEKFNEMKGFELLPNDIIMSCSGTIGKIAIFPPQGEKGIINQALLRLRPLNNISTPFLKILLEGITNSFVENSHGAGLQNVASVSVLKDIKIPLPPIDIQQKIVLEIEILDDKENNAKEEVEKLRDGIKNVYFISKSKFDISILSNEIQIVGGGTPNTNKGEYWDGDIPWLSIVDFKGENRYVEKTEKKITEEGLKNSSAKYLDVNDIIISARGTVGALAQLKIPMTFNQSCYGIKAGLNLSSDFLYFALKFEIEQFRNNAYGTIFDAITTRTFDLIKIPLPPLSEQQKIVSEIEKIEAKIKVLETEIAAIPKQKEAVLKKYL
ncbi:restriction endonuclease subunit S [Mariniflexile sp.]|uniref:restriction endonuclease subunit S n=1 Tax=Mariniflexile sp. TaxID=1979402 RepID=UPI004048BE7C